MQIWIAADELRSRHLGGMLSVVVLNAQGFGTMPGPTAFPLRSRPWIVISIPGVGLKVRMGRTEHCEIGVPRTSERGAQGFAQRDSVRVHRLAEHNLDGFVKDERL